MNNCSIIAQQIDVAVIGSKAYQLLELIIERDLDLKHLDNTKNKYLNMLSKFLGERLAPDAPKSIPKSKKSSFGISKYSKNILTNSFWVQLHFFIIDKPIYDVLLSEKIKGNINLCIIATDNENNDLNELKSILISEKTINKESNWLTRYLFRDQLKNNLSIMSKIELSVQADFMRKMFEPQICGFKSLLTVRVLNEQKRIIQQSSRLKLSCNQIIRWITQRHFEAKYDIILKNQLGDELENYEASEQKNICKLI